MPNTPHAHEPPRSLSDMHPIAKVSVGQILGLVEAIDEVGGSSDVATIAQEVEMDIDRLGPIIDAAELLGFVKVAEGDLTITDLSREDFIRILTEPKGALTKQYEAKGVRLVAVSKTVDTARIQEALDAGLIDGIGYLEDSLEQARKLANVERASVVTYFRPGEYRANLYSLNLVNIDMSALAEPGMNFLYVWWP